MKTLMRMFLKSRFLPFLLAFSFLTCSQPKEKIVKTDLEQIRTRGKLIALTGYSATSYFIYRGQPMGYEYELLSLLSEHLGLKLEIKIEDNLEQLFTRLNAGDADIIAHDLTVTKERRQRMQFTDYLFTTQQVLVQRKPDNWRRMKLHEIERRLITNPIQLIGKRVYVKKNSSHVERLKNLSEEIGGDIEIVEVDGDTTSELLIQMVSEGKIDYTIADRHVALINQAYLTNLDVQMAVSFPQQIAWAVRKTSPELLKAVNEWIQSMKQKTAFYVIYNKYFKNRGAYIRRAKSDYLSVTGGKISEYDDFLKKKAAQIGWDWRLLASLIYQESQFNPFAKSWSGAAGIMQLQPETARRFGATNVTDPYENISAGVNYLKWLDNYWKKEIADPTERIKFILASYNVGIGHVQDARRLAQKYGKDPDLWEDNTEYYLLRLSEEKFFNDEVVQFGYCRGSEPCNYVKEILERYNQYRKFILA